LFAENPPHMEQGFEPSRARRVVRDRLEESERCNWTCQRCPGRLTTRVDEPELEPNHKEVIMAKKSRGGRMTAAKKRAAKRRGGKGPVKNRKVGKKIMKT
jgi:hypothetical protein